jgi:uncharacterized protein
VKLVDANVLLYAYDSSSPHHNSCRDWFESALNAPEAIALPWQTLLAFVRIATNPRAVREPLSGAAACSIVATWLERPNVVVPDPGERFWEIFHSQVRVAEVSGPRVTDAALASMALELGATLCSTDRDFRRFDGLRILNPAQTSAPR